MSERTITTEATADREALPDLATVDVEVTVDADSASAARATARDRTATVRETLTSIVASTDDVRTIDYRIKEGDNDFGPDIDGEFRAEIRLQVDCVPETVPDIVDSATDASGTVPDVEFHLHEDVHQRLRDEALEGAMERAREKADHIAAVEGTAVGDMREATVGDGYVKTTSTVDDALSDLPDGNFQPTPITVTESVTVVYDIADQSGG